MNDATRRKLRLATEEAWQAAEQVDKAGPPRPGDLFAIPETSHLAVEWAVLDEDPATRRLYGVPADTLRFLGRHDVHVAPTSPCGPLNLRCGLGLWLTAERFDPELRSGVLERGELDRAREARAASERDVGDAADEDPEYLEWIDDGPAKARALLEERPASGRVLDFKPPPRVVLWKSVALAASVLLALTLAAGGVHVARLRTEVRELRTADPRPAANVAVRSLHRTRGPQDISVPADATALVFRVNDPDLEPSTSYRGELRAEGSSRVICCEDPLRLDDDSGGLTFLVPAPLPAGEYRVRLFAGDDELFATYRINIEVLDDDHLSP